MGFFSVATRDVQTFLGLGNFVKLRIRLILTQSSLVYDYSSPPLHQFVRAIRHPDSSVAYPIDAVDPPEEIGIP